MQINQGRIIFEYIVFFIIFAFHLNAFADSIRQEYYITDKGCNKTEGCTPGDVKDGTSLTTAWSVSDFNSSSNWSATDTPAKIDPGDTVYFSGTITGQIKPPGDGSSGNFITLDGYKGGDLDPVADHIYLTGVHTGTNNSDSLTTMYADWENDCLKGTTLWNWTDRSSCTVTGNGANSASCNLSGGTDNNWDRGDVFTIVGDNIDIIPDLPATRAVLRVSNDSAVVLRDTEYIILQDFEIDGNDSTRIGIYARPSNGGSLSYVAIRRNFIHDTRSNAIDVDPSTDYNIQPQFITIGGGIGNGNFVYNCELDEDSALGESAQGNLIGAFGNNLVISHNEVGTYWAFSNNSTNRIATFTGDGLLFEYNTIWMAEQSALSVKENHRKNGVVRFNKIVGNGYGIAISVSTTFNPNEQIYVYGNAVFNMLWGIRTYKDYDNVHVWSNIVSGFKGMPLWVGGRSSGDNVGLTRWYNNTVSNYGLDSTIGDSGRAIRINLPNDSGGFTPDCEFKNTVAYNGDPNSGKFLFVYLYPTAASYLNQLDYNAYYSPGGTEKFYQGGAGWLDFAGLQAKGWEPNGISGENLYLTDPDGADSVIGTPDDDLSLQSDSPARDTGATLTGPSIGTPFVIYYYDGSTVALNSNELDYADALDPNRTDWNTTPPTVYTQKQTDGEWERGAYVYTDSQIPSPPVDLRIMSQ